MAVSVKSTMSLSVTPCSLVDTYQCFGGTLKKPEGNIAVFPYCIYYYDQKMEADDSS
jgi:hypothetical protein